MEDKKHNNGAVLSLLFPLRNNFTLPGLGFARLGKEKARAKAAVKRAASLHIRPGCEMGRSKPTDAMYKTASDSGAVLIGLH